MALPEFTMRQLLEAGVHFGHHTRRWNPKMSPYIFGVRNGIHIIDLEQTVPLLRQGIEAIREVVAGGGRVLIVGTKRQAQDAVAESNTLRIPVVAILDSNSSPDGIAYPIPGNDDAMRAVHLYSEWVASAVLDGLQAELAASGVDIGARAVLPAEVEAEEEPVDDEALAAAAETEPVADEPPVPEPEAPQAG